MKTVSIRFSDMDKKTLLYLGYVGENLHRRILIDCKKEFEEMPGAIPALVVTAPNGLKYPVDVTVEGNTVIWDITNSDLIHHGNGEIQLTLTKDSEVGKSAKCRTKVDESIEPDGEAPDPIENWLIRAENLLKEIPEEIANAIEKAKESGLFDGVGISSIGYVRTVGNVNIYRINLTDGSFYDFEVSNGEDGQPGTNGVGITNIAKTGTVGLVDTYTITLTNGQTYPFTVTNGQNGAEIDDTTPALNKVFSSSKVNGELTQLKSDLTLIDETLDKMVKTSDNVYEPSDSKFEDHVLAVNSSGKCLFYGSSDYAYRGFIFPLGDISKNLGYKFTYEGSGISSVKLCCYQYKPTSNTDTFVALNQITGTKEGNDYTGLLPVSENSAYIVFAVSFTSGANYDNIYKAIKNALFIFETTAATWNDVDWSEIEYAPRALLNLNMKSIPQELLDEINDKVEKLEGYGLSKNDFSDTYKGKVDEAYEHLHPTSDVIVKYGDQGITSGSWASPTNGQIYTTSSTAIYDVTDFIPCENGEILYLCEVQSIAFYNSAKTFIGGVTIANIDGYTGNGLQNNLTISQQNVAYMRINFYNSNYTSNILNGRYAACRRNTDDYAILNMGDSIYGLNPKPYDLSSVIESVTGKKTANCGFGGTRAAVHSLTEYNKFSLYNLADAIYSEDYTTQDEADFSALGSGYYYKYNLRTLESIDFDKLYALTIAYGTNDWNASVPIDNENDPMDTDTFKGALRYSISKIQGKYPKLLIILVAPLFRTFSSEQKDSNTKTNSNGKTLVDFVEAIKEVADEYELPFIDMYHMSGINTFNSTTFLRDETHLTFEDGVKRVGKITGEKVKDYVTETDE